MSRPGEPRRLGGHRRPASGLGTPGVLAVLVAVLLVVLALVAVATRTGLIGRPGPATASVPPARSAAAAVSAPPLVDQAVAHLLVSPAVLPPTGGYVALTVDNPTATALTHGVAGTVQRWDGARWQPDGGFVGSLARWGMPGALVPAGRTAAAPGIALAVPAHGAGSAVLVRIDGLGVGWYRFALGQATGILEIRAGVPPTLPTYNN